MGDGYRTEPLHRSMPINDFAGEHDPSRRHPPPHAYANHDQPKGHPSAADLASVLGLPAESLSPALLTALVSLLSELDRLRWELGQAERRLDWRERQADRHSIVPCLSRRAFVRELEFLLLGGDVHGSLAVLQVAGIEALRQIHGMAAGDGALRHCCANILGGLRSTDLVGCLGGSDFAVLLLGAGADEARDKLGEIVGRIKDPAFTWLGQRIPLIPAFGLAVMNGDGAEQMLAAADRDRRGLR